MEKMNIQKYIKLNQIQPLDTILSTNNTCVVFGLLSKSEDGIITLEDPYGRIVLDISECISFLKILKKS